MRYLNVDLFGSGKSCTTCFKVVNVSSRLPDLSLSEKSQGK